MRYILVFLLFGSFFIVSCTNNLINETECTSDSECTIGGCSGEVCTTKDKAKDLVTTCIYLPEYDCLKQTVCKCIDGKCQWEETQEYKDCMKNLSDLT